MPLYEYKCAKCQVVIEKIQKFSDEPLKVHEGCGGELERLMGKPSLRFKGSGFYITDYKKSGSSQPSKNGKGSESKSETKSESKSEPQSESKPAAPSDAKASAPSGGSTSPKQA